MKLPAYDLPIGKSHATAPPQSRRKTPKIAPVLLILTFFFTIIPIYYPTVRYNLKKLTSATSFDSVIPPVVVDHHEAELINRLQQSEKNLVVDESKIGEKVDDDDDTTANLKKSDEKFVTRSDGEGDSKVLNSKIEEKVVDDDDDESEAKSKSKSKKSDEKVELLGIVNESKSDDESPPAEKILKKSDESTEVNITYQPSNDNVGDDNEKKVEFPVPEKRRKSGGKKGRRRNSHRKKDPETRRKGGRIRPEHEDSGRSTTTTAATGGGGGNEQESKEYDDNKSGITTISATSTTNNEVESNGAINESHISSLSCDLFTGEWIPNPEGPYYTNETCFAIQEHQNCMKFGRPDKEYLKWRWKPDGCELPLFEPSRFLELVRGKSLAFVGDSVARNHMQSLLCLLSRVAYPEDLSKSINDQNRLYLYKDYNFTISMYWSPYLVKTELTEPGNVTRPFNLFLDEFDPNWTTQIHGHDYIIISAGQWFMRPTYFYEKQKLLGCLYCPPSENTPYKDAYFSYRRAFRTLFRAINSLGNKFNGVVFLRTFAPSHFEGGPWDSGGKCSRTRPFKRNETVLEDYAEKMYTIQLEELEIARREERRSRGPKKFRLFDSTKMMLLRPDGHPSKYGHWPDQRVELPEDCVHWCLPGPIDAWNDFLLELLRREQDIPIQ